jgi:membrane associated rhomboid family serine protease
MAIHRYNPDSKPVATLTLVAINVGVAVLDIAQGGLLERMFWARGTDIQYGEVWRLFTSAWVHAHPLHIAFNAYGLWLLGSMVERVQGRRVMLTIYFVSLFGGGALAMVFMDPARPLLGASGAVYGLFGAVLGFFYARAGSVRGLLEIPIARQLLIWLAIGVYISLQPGISFLGHLGGFVPGALLGFYFEHRYLRRADIWHHVSAAVLVLAVVGLTVFAAVPVTRASYQAARALRAYEAAEFERGDALLRRAREGTGHNAGTVALLTHLRRWRQGHARDPRLYDTALLRWPLTHANPPWEPAGPTDYFRYLPDPD